MKREMGCLAQRKIWRKPKHKQGKLTFNLLPGWSRGDPLSWACNSLEGDLPFPWAWADSEISTRSSLRAPCLLELAAAVFFLLASPSMSLQVSPWAASLKTCPWRWWQSGHFQWGPTSPIFRRRLQRQMSKKKKKVKNNLFFALFLLGPLTLLNPIATRVYSTVRYSTFLE